MKQNDKRYQYVVFVSLCLIVFGGFLLRFYQVGELPTGLYSDEATNGTDALKALDTHHFQIFYPNNNGREGLFINLQAVSIWLFGNTTFALRFVSVLFGTLAIVGMYYLAQELWQRRLAGLIGAFLMATSYWAINFSRIGLRAIMVPAMLAFTVYFFLKGIRRKKSLDFFIAGVLLGIGLNSYIVFRVVPFIFIILVPVFLSKYKKFLKDYWRCFIFLGIGASLIVIPLVIVFYHHPAYFFERINEVSLLSPALNHGHILSTLGLNTVLTLLQYNLIGDFNWRQNYPPYPLLDPVVGLLFLGGFIGLIKQTFQCRYDPKLMLRNTVIVVTFFVMLIPELLSAEHLPSALRAIGTQPAVFLLATWAGLWVVDYARIQKVQLHQALIIMTLLVFLFGSATFNGIKYFVFFANSPKEALYFNQNYTDMAKFIMLQPQATIKYFNFDTGSIMIDNGLPVTVQAVYFLTAQHVQNLQFIFNSTNIQPHNSVVILQALNQGYIDQLKTLYPWAKVETYNDFTVIRFL